MRLRINAKKEKHTDS